MTRLRWEPALECRSEGRNKRNAADGSDHAALSYSLVSE